MNRDKLYHLAAGAVIALAVGLLLTPLLGLGAALVAGVAKEAYDATGRGTVEALDAVATVVGGAVIYGVLTCV